LWALGLDVHWITSQQWAGQHSSAGLAWMCGPGSPFEVLAQPVEWRLFFLAFHRSWAGCIVDWCWSCGGLVRLSMHLHFCSTSSHVFLGCTSASMHAVVSASVHAVVDVGTWHASWCVHCCSHRACLAVCMPCFSCRAARHSMSLHASTSPVCSCQCFAQLAWTASSLLYARLLLAGGGGFAWWTLLACGARLWSICCRACGSVGLAGMGVWCWVAGCGARCAAFMFHLLVECWHMLVFAGLAVKPGSCIGGRVRRICRPLVPGGGALKIWAVAHTRVGCARPVASVSPLRAPQGVVLRSPGSVAMLRDSWVTVRQRGYAS
jgi:hypothetical protein